jgi:hypothetical protein
MHRSKAPVANTSFDHFVGAQQERFRDSQPERLAEAYENYAVDVGYQYSFSQPDKWYNDMKAYGYALWTNMDILPERTTSLNTRLSTGLRGYSDRRPMRSSDLQSGSIK